MGQARPVLPLALVVEDDALQRMSLSDLLEDEHVEVLQCASAEAAELLFDHYGEAINLLLTDVNLAGQRTGIELARRAKARFPKLQIVVMSGRPYDVPSDLHFIRKPFQPLDVLRELLK